MDSEIRVVDRARAAQLVMASVTRDSLMFAATFQEIVDDVYGLGELGSLINVLRIMADDLGGAIVDVHGAEAGQDLVRAMLLGLSAEASDTPYPEGGV